MKIDVRSNIKDWTRGQKKFKDQIPYATSRAINAQAEEAEKVVNQEIQRAVDNPVPFTKRASFHTKSNKRMTPIKAIVGVKDKQAEYLEFVEDGGVSHAIGKAKPVPTSHFKNRSGNIPKSRVSKVLHDTERYFSGKPKGKRDRPAGVYQRIGPGGRKLRMLAKWQKETRHKKRMRIGERIKVIVQRNFPKHWKRELEKAIMTAR